MTAPVRKQTSNIILLTRFVLPIALLFLRGEELQSTEKETSSAESSLDRRRIIQPSEALSDSHPAIAGRIAIVQTNPRNSKTKIKRLWDSLFHHGSSAVASAQFTAAREAEKRGSKLLTSLPREPDVLS